MTVPFMRQLVRAKGAPVFGLALFLGVSVRMLLEELNI